MVLVPAVIVVPVLPAVVVVGVPVLLAVVVVVVVVGALGVVVVGQAWDWISRSATEFSVYFASRKG